MRKAKANVELHLMKEIKDKKKMCFNNLVAFCDVVTSWENEQTAMAVAYPDFSKVLDTILHSRKTWDR